MMEITVTSCDTYTQEYMFFSLLFFACFLRVLCFFLHVYTRKENGPRSCATVHYREWKRCPQFYIYLL